MQAIEIQGETANISPDVLAHIVSGFKPETIGLLGAWRELYMAVQAAHGDPELLQAIHDIIEAIEDAGE
jgi:hypothetical protein